MRIGTTQARFSAGRPSYEWHDFSYLHSAKSASRATLSLHLALWIAIVDLCWPHTNIAVLYVAPLVLIAESGTLKHYWRAVGPLILLTYGVYVLKYFVYHTASDPNFFDSPFVNRSLVVVSILVMGKVLQLWVAWRAEQSEAEVSESFRYQDQQISSTFAMLSSAPLVAVIALVDYLMPANLNLAILYPIPLLICGWTRSQGLLWGMLLLLLSLTFIGYWFGGPPTTANLGFSMQRNRILAGLGMLTVTAILSYWIGRDETGST